MGYVYLAWGIAVISRVILMGQQWVTVSVIEDQKVKIRVYHANYDQGKVGIVQTGSFPIGDFIFKETRGRISIDPTQNTPSHLVPLNEGEYYFMALRERDTSPAQLNLVYGYFGNEPDPVPSGVPPSDLLLTLQSTPSRYDLLYPHQFYQFALQAPFFYQDDERTYFVSPEDLRNGTHSFQPNSIIPPLNHATAASAITNNGSNTGNLPIFDYATLTVAEGSAVNTPAALTLKKDLVFRPFGGGGPIPSTRFFLFYHPHVENFIKRLNQGGIPILLTLDTQRLTNDVQGKGIIKRFENEYNANLK